MTKMSRVTAVIIASGLATRLGSTLPVGMPKCMLEFGGVPFIDYLLGWVFKSGIEKVVITTSAVNDEMLKKHIVTRWAGKCIDVVIEDKAISTTISAYAGLQRVQTEYAFVMTADNIWGGVSLDGRLESLISRDADGMALIDSNPGPNSGMVKIQKPDLIVSMYPGTGHDDKPFDLAARTAGLYLAKTRPLLESIVRTPEDIRASGSIEREPFSQLNKILAHWLGAGTYVDFGTPSALSDLRNNVHLISDAFGNPEK